METLFGYMCFNQSIRGTYAGRWARPSGILECRGFTVQGHPYFEVPAILRPRKVPVDLQHCTVFWLINTTIH